MALTSQPTHSTTGLPSPTLQVPIIFDGLVVEGDRRGREIGFPTANIEQPHDFAAPDGVYAGFVRRESGDLYLSAVSIGRRETFYAHGGTRLVEAHLLDFSDDLYGERLTIDLRAFLRPQVRYEHVPELIEQIVADVIDVRRLLAD